MISIEYLKDILFETCLLAEAVVYDRITDNLVPEHT